MLTARNLRKSFTSVLAIDDVSFEVGRGEILGLLGPNGAGKTTSIRMVLNILLPDSGSVTYDGVPFSEGTRNAVGYLPEERGLYRKSRLWDTVLYFAQLKGMDASRARAEAHRWLKRFDLLPHRDRKLDELSKGNQQKAQFVIAVLHNPPLLILDEPFSGLDPVNQILFKDVLLELKSQGKAVVYSTHQMDSAERLSDRICLINEGRVVLRGEVHEIKRRYGTNAVHLEFDGDGSFLGTLPQVHRCDAYPNSAELQLSPGANPQELFPHLIDRLSVKKFEVLEPSLHSIFLEVVGKGSPSSDPGRLQPMPGAL
jgi:ABC-2 type transport system ATP-binding protein